MVWRVFRVDQSFPSGALHVTTSNSLIGVHQEIAGIALDFMGMAIKHSAKYLTLVEISNIDYDTIIGNMYARDDIIITSD
jgi:hypothetical protein